MLPVFGLFHKRIDGDDALLDLARKRFARVGMAPEFYCGSADDLRGLLAYLPWPGAPATVHLPRGIDLLCRDSRNWIMALAAEFRGRIYGFVVHDQPELTGNADSYEKAVRRLDAALQSLPESPLLFIEYARMLPFDDFYGFFLKIRDTRRTSTCLDIGHLGIRQVEKEFAAIRPGTDIFSFKNSSGLPAAIRQDIAAAVNRVLPVVREQIREFCRLGKPLHFHLHDAHPLWNKSPFGVSDHLSFFQEIPVRDEQGGTKTVPLMYGHKGLRQIIDLVRRSMSPEMVSLSLEIHPAGGLAPLGEDAGLFAHWCDTTNAEKMNSWLQTLQNNHELLVGMLGRGLLQ